MSFVSSLTVSVSDTSFANLLLANSDGTRLADGTYAPGSIVISVTDAAGSTTRYVTYDQFIVDMSGPVLSTDLCSNFTNSSILSTNADNFIFDISAFDVVSKARWRKRTRAVPL